jgi:alkylation response protein AidB-like acyl-CoA dehydrogenase
MPRYQAPVDEVLFLLTHVLPLKDHADLPGFGDLSPDMIEAIVREGAQVCEDFFQPVNTSGDRQGCQRLPDGRVVTPEGFKAAYDAYRKGGWLGLSAPEAYGGQGLPNTLNHVMGEFTASANMALSMYGGLTQGAFAALLQHASPEQKALYIPPMIEGRWTGTMNLTEPHCGTDLGLIKTRAIALGDGSFAITGQKIFISAGEHDLADNIVHLVLARLSDAPEGTRGISLFLVPKFLVNADGSLGERNHVTCGAIEHKMGIHGNATCVMNYDQAKGVLIGEANRGLQAMFVMMNEARLGVAIQGLAQSEVAYQNAAIYAKERLQGRALTGASAPDKPADPIIVHPDIRRILMEIRSFNEAARALILWDALQGDIAHRSQDPKALERANDLQGLLTPVLKGVLTDLGFDNCVKAQQIFGGHGYVSEWGMEQFVRDARIAMIYEGANGIQALDLVGRKLPKDGGRAIRTYLELIGRFIHKRESNEALKPFLQPFKQGVGHLQEATLWFMSHAIAKPTHAGAGAYDYMHLFGLVSLGHMWVMMAEAALGLQAQGEDPQRQTTRLTLAAYFMERAMPKTGLHLKHITSGADIMMSLPADSF